jgi:hypothetical protein
MALFMNATIMLAQPAATITVGDGLITVSSPRYAVAFRVADGSIARIIDAATGKVVSGGNASLWAATFEDDSKLAGSSTTFSYSVDSDTLTLRYDGALTVTVTAASGEALTLQAEVVNHAGKAVRLFSFPGDLALTPGEVRDALLPLMPGALLNADFFRKGVTYTEQYPGAMFADYAGVRAESGALALYTRRGGVVQPVYLGFVADANGAALRHNFKTWIKDGANWTSSAVVARVGEDYPATIAAYRAENGIDQYPSLRDKLGDQAAAYFAAPMYKLDLAALGLPFAQLKDAVIARLNLPGIIHFVAFQNGGHDNNYPDFIPPAPRWGSTEDFAGLVAALHDRGNLAIPYTNFSWWDNNGPALTSLPDGLALPDVVVTDAHGIPAFESYGPRSGFVVDPNSGFFRQKVAEQHDLLIHTVGMDGIFEDQWGARDVPYDFSPAAADHPDTAYFEGALAHFSEQAGNHLMVEQGVDALAENAVGFMGTNYLWDMLGYRVTAAYTRYYPMAAMLLRDKVLLYQHNLAAQTWTKNKDMLRWNLAQGYSLSNAVFDETLPGLNMDNPWLNLIGVFQKYALASYADQRITAYDDLGGEVARTRFETYTVYANDSAAAPYTPDGLDATLPPGGVLTIADDGSVMAGVFTRFGGQELSEGDHYLVVTRAANEVMVFQPVGSDTPLRLRVPGWAQVTVEACHYDGTAIAPVDTLRDGDAVTFEYAGVVNSEAVGYYRVTAG